ncbi:hypothetical protein [Microbispora sp. H10670]|uniref:hypothetical protein n=1 Tax=Microbispora sp. H10670 TaxID=2729108 RepID=UPI001C728E0D|nr:hypothetical protein [Microbispora sp. H10670]
MVAVHVTHPGDERDAQRLIEDWQRWDPGVELVQVSSAHRRLDEPLTADPVVAAH